MRSTSGGSVLAAATALVLGAGAAAAQPAAMGWQGFANAWIAAHAQRVRGQAPREARKSCEGDINGDGHGDVVVIYTIEAGGSGAWTQYATVLTSTQQGYGATLPKEVGGKGTRIVESCAVAPGKVEISFKTWAAADAACCPSVPGKATLSFANGALAEAPSASSSR
ncbi:MAG: hypothetical protein B6D46_10100 [Polyangiaceae bacterium UTPRO1]|nr:hypothetical protein [Myxococcales bacterium]OQY66516.1 MAG: hypothetical protein B6D46_10100 [Polyangiaceae bacterium UTPRO1]